MMDQGRANVKTFLMNLSCTDRCSKTKQTRAHRRQYVLLAIFTSLFAWALALGYYQYRFNLNEPPDPSGDEIDYDAMGWELSKGHGFQVDTGDPAFRLPYENAALAEPRFDIGPPRKGVLTSRPPFFPLILAGTDVAFGRQFWGARVFNSGCIAITAGLLIWLLLERRGRGPAIVAFLLFIFVDQRTRLYGRTLLTEPLSILLVTLLLFVLLKQFQQRHIRWPIMAGVLFGIAVLVRSLFILWLPGLILLVAGITALHVTQNRLRRGLLDATIFTVITMLVLSPWMVRNCLVLDRFMPLGTQGTSQLSAAFSDSAWSERGHWVNLYKRGFFDPALNDRMSILEAETAMADYSALKAREWIAKNPVKAVILAPMKVGLELYPRSVGEFVVLIMAIFGAAVSRKDVISRIGLMLFLINACAIGMTWSVEGRFLVPLLFVIHYWAAIGGWWLLQKTPFFANGASPTPLSHAIPAT